MKSEHDLSIRGRGKFYRKTARLNLPVCLDQSVQDFLQQQARSRGVEIGPLVNEMPR